MGQDYSPWVYQQRSPWCSSELNCTGIQPDGGQENTHPLVFPTNMASASRAMPEFAFPELPPLKSVISNEPKKWVYCNTNQNFAQVTKSMAGERFLFSPYGEAVPNSGSTAVEKGLLVFDQTGNRTSLIFSSFGSPLQYPSSVKPKQINPTGLCAGLPISKDPATLDPLKTMSWCGESDETDVVSGGRGSEMHEDTEELDALLCSDDEEDDDDEVTSTGHSPIDMAGYEIKEKVNESAQVTNPVTPTKRRRRDEETDMALMDTASSGKPFRSFDYEVDAELSCIKGNLQAESASSPNKRLRKEKIRETVGVLRSIIPGGKGKDAAMVLDEAICYLRTLRLKAKALGAVSTLK